MRVGMRRHQKRLRKMADDNWIHRSKNMLCATCMYFVRKHTERPRTDEIAVEDDKVVGRCRRHAPTMNGWPVMFPGDWCGDHKLDENKL